MAAGGRFGHRWAATSQAQASGLAAPRWWRATCAERWPYLGCFENDVPNGLPN